MLEIRSAILTGDIDTGLRLTQDNYSSVFRNNDLIYFRLRCRKFIEMLRLSTTANPTPAADESERRRGKKMSRTRGSFDGVFGHQMELDDHMGGTGVINGSVRPTSGDWDGAMDTSEDPTLNGNTQTPGGPANGETTTTTAAGVISDMDLFAYGTVLRTEFSHDSRREVKRELEDTLALMVYPNPRESALADLLEESNRSRLAEDLNSAILGLFYPVSL
jgi:hypothetical protein